MNNNVNIFRTIVIILFAVLGVGAAFISGGVARIAINSTTTKLSPQISSYSKLEAYYLKAGKIMRTDSDTSDEKILTPTQIFGDEEYLSQPPFVLAGEKQEFLVYLVSRNISTDLSYDQYAKIELRALNLFTNEDRVLEAVDWENTSLHGLAVSPDGKKIAYAKSIGDGTQDISQIKDELIVYDISTNSKEKFERSISTSWIVPQAYAGGGFSLLNVYRWLSNTEVIIGYSYEGVSYCSIDITKDKSLPQQCDNLGSSYFMTNMAYLKNDNNIYGFQRTFNIEAAGTDEKQGIFRRSTSSQEKFFITNDVVSDMVLANSMLYFFGVKSQQTQSAHTDTDLYTTDLEGKNISRLTEDGNSVKSKQHLTVSKDGRYLAYDLYQITDLDVAKGVRPEISSAWIYDSVLKRAYRVADQAAFPFVVAR